MRTREDTQAQLGFQRSLGAAATQEYFARYSRISSILERHPQLLRAVHADLEGLLTRMARGRRRAKFTSDTVLRILLVKAIEGLSFRAVVIRVDDSERLRDFTRLGNDRVMDFSTLNGLANAIRPETWQRLNELLATAAAREGRIDGERLRLDTTAVETNVHWPTDSHLMWDAYRALSRWVHRVRDVAPELVAAKRLHERAAKRLHARIARASARRSPAGLEEKKRQYSRLIRLLDGVLGWVPSLVRRLEREGARSGASLADLLFFKVAATQLQHYRGLGLRVVDQARRRVLRGEQVPNGEKVFSIFEPHTEILQRGKAGKEVEFGHMVSLHQVEGSFITDYRVFERRPADHELIDPALRQHERVFGRMPQVLAADKGFWESSEKTKSLGETIECVSIAKKGARTEEETAREHTSLFRLGQRFRAGVEGSISFLKRVLGLARCLNKGMAHFAATVGATVFAHNLLVLARTG